jgi:predicted acyltransferase
MALWLPVNMFQTLRGGYGSSVVGALAETLVIWTITVMSFLVLVVASMVWAWGQL